VILGISIICGVFWFFAVYVLVELHRLHARIDSQERQIDGLLSTIQTIISTSGIHTDCINRLTETRSGTESKQ
jgi:uncharacterized protein YoxC